MTEDALILTLSCSDRTGIVAGVSSALAEIGAFIIESAQYGDPYAKHFFMRLEFTLLDGNLQKIEDALKPIFLKFQMKWHLQKKSYKPKVIIMVSKQSHCLNDLLHRYSIGHLRMEIPAIISNHEDLKEMALLHHIPFYHLPINQTNKLEQEKHLLDLAKLKNADLIVLARYMQILSSGLCKELSGKIINIHHSFLPSFKGSKPYHQAFERGVKLVGATAHYATSDLDEGPIIEQEVIRVSHDRHPEDLVALGRDIESLVLSRAVKLHLERRVFLNGQKTVIFN